MRKRDEIPAVSMPSTTPVLDCFEPRQRQGWGQPRVAMWKERDVQVLGRGGQQGDLSFGTERDTSLDAEGS
jgi:hypothetical protein